MKPHLEEISLLTNSKYHQWFQLIYVLRQCVKIKYITMKKILKCRSNENCNCHYKFAWFFVLLEKIGVWFASICETIVFFENIHCNFRWSCFKMTFMCIYSDNPFMSTAHLELRDNVFHWLCRKITNSFTIEMFTIFVDIGLFESYYLHW